MERDAVRRWFDGHRAAERRQSELRRQEGVPPASESFAAALELLELAEPTRDDPVRDRELTEVRRMWARLKRPWAEKHA
jgi:hypothetical protein